MSAISAAVDLDRVERQAGEVGEAAIAGAEIVDRDAHSRGAEHGEPRGGGGLVGEQAVLGDFDGDPLGLEAGGGDFVEQPALIARPGKILGEQVDRQAQVGERPGPLADHAQRLALDQPRQAFRLAGGGGAGEQFFGRIGAVPAGERLDSADVAGGQIDLRLEMDRDRVRGRWRFRARGRGAVWRAPDQAGPTPASRPGTVSNHANIMARPRLALSGEGRRLWPSAPQRDSGAAAQKPYVCSPTSKKERL